MSAAIYRPASPPTPALHHLLVIGCASERVARNASVAGFASGYCSRLIRSSRRRSKVDRVVNSPKARERSNGGATNNQRTASCGVGLRGGSSALVNEECAEVLWHQAALIGRAERVGSARVNQTPTCSAMARRRRLHCQDSARCSQSSCARVATAPLFKFRFGDNLCPTPHGVQLHRIGAFAFLFADKVQKCANA